VFALQNVPQQPTRIAGLAVEPFDTGPVPPKFDLELSMVEADGALAASIVLCGRLFDAATIERLAGHFARLLDAIVADPERRIAELRCSARRAPAARRLDRHRRALYEDRCLHELFAAQAARTPDAPAVIWERGGGGRIARSAMASSTAAPTDSPIICAPSASAPNIVVGLSMTRSPEMVVGVLGILRPAAPTCRSIPPIRPTVSPTCWPDARRAGPAHARHPR